LAKPFEIVVVQKAHFPNFDQAPKKVREEMAAVVEGSLIANILDGKQASGLPLKTNKRATADRKRRKGWLHDGQVKSLIAEKQRIIKGGKKSFVWKLGKNLIEFKPAATWRNINRWVQEKGYTGFWGLSKDGEKAVRETLRLWIKSSFKKAAAKK
jgi:hypothetical protein